MEGSSAESKDSSSKNSRDSSSKNSSGSNSSQEKLKNLIKESADEGDGGAHRESESKSDPRLLN